MSPTAPWTWISAFETTFATKTRLFRVDPINRERFNR